MRRLLAAIIVALLPYVSMAAEPTQLPEERPAVEEKERPRVKERAVERIVRAFGLKSEDYIDRQDRQDLYLPQPNRLFAGPPEDFGHDARSRIARRLLTRVGGDAITAAIPGLESRIERLDAYKEEVLDQYTRLHYKGPGVVSASVGAAIRFEENPVGIVVRSRFSGQRAYLELFRDEVTFNYEVPVFGEKLVVSAGERDGKRSYSVRWRLTK